VRVVGGEPQHEPAELVDGHLLDGAAGLGDTSF
jgi:hypothetical protein